MKWIREKLEYWIEGIIINRITIGGNCGLCGKWIPDELFPRYWRWGSCKDCTKEYGDEK